MINRILLKYHYQELAKIFEWNGTSWTQKGPSILVENIGQSISMYDNSTVGIVGLGSIGFTFGKMLSGFNCEILYTGPREKKELGDQINAKYVSFEVKDTAISSCI